MQICLPEKISRFTGAVPELNLATEGAAKAKAQSSDAEGAPSGHEGSVCKLQLEGSAEGLVPLPEGEVKASLGRLCVLCKYVPAGGMCILNEYCQSSVDGCYENGRVEDRDGHFPRMRDSRDWLGEHALNEEKPPRDYCCGGWDPPQPSPLPPSWDQRGAKNIGPNYDNAACLARSVKLGVERLRGLLEKVQGLENFGLHGLKKDTG
ncbi:hypothetical protein KM043_013039 [Ampulex compressa]|nr:hypothetical protein KM043_013039 [Ampulex compressa]